MPKRGGKENRRRRQRHFMRDWRKAIKPKRSQAEIGEELGISGAQVSRIETGKSPYTQDILEGFADIVGQSVETILSRGPGKKKPN